MSANLVKKFIMHAERANTPTAHHHSVTEAYEEAYRRRENTVESQSPLGIGIDLEKRWTPLEASLSGNSSEAVAEPEKIKSRSDRSDDGSEQLEAFATPRRVVTAQDWMGPDDPENPMNWPTWKKVYHAIPCALFGFVV
jgi:hypothetical protein